MTGNARLIRGVLAFALLGCAQLLLYSTACSQDAAASRSIQYRRVFVPSENLPLLGPDFVPVDIDELDALLKSHRDQAKPPLDNSTPVLIQSLFVASLIDEVLVSDASRITIACQAETPRFYTFNPCSLAIRSTTISSQDLAKSVREGRVVENQPFRYDVQGLPTIAVKQPTDFWFGWTLHGESEHDSSRLQFKLAVPQCMDSRLLLQLPPMWRVESKTCVVRPWEDPNVLLGPTWPGNVEVDEGKESVNWWLIELSGSTSQSFELVQSVDAFPLNFDCVVARERIDYRLLPSSLEVVSEWQFADSIASLPAMTIRMDPGFHVSSVMLDELPMEWRPGQLPFSIDVLHAGESDDLESSTRQRLIVRGLATWPLTDGQKRLPMLQLEKAFSLDGVGSLAIHQDWVVNHVKIENGRIFSRSGTTQLGGLGRCDFEWAGGPPEITLQASPRSQQGRADALTRLTNDSDGLVATTWVNIAANSNPRSAMRFALSQGWVVESVQATDRRYTTTVHRIPNSDQSEWQVQITPAVENQAMTLEIRSRCTSLIGSDNANSKTLTFDGDRPITFRDLKQTDIYWIEPTGRYKIEANPELLQCQIDSQKITESQRQRLPRIGEVWLIKPDGSKLPRLTFRRQSAPYTAQLETTIQPSLIGVSANYRLKCVPLAGAVSSVTVDVQHSDDIAIRWRQRKTATDSSDQWMPVQSIDLRRDNRKVPKNANNASSAARIVQINLPSAMSEEFELEGFADFPMPSVPPADETIMRIPLVSLPEAAQKDATFEIDERLTLAQSSDNAPWTPLGYVRFKNDLEVFRFRYDPIQLAAVHIQPNQPSRLPDVWLADVVLRYRHYLDGKNECELQSQLHAIEASVIDFNIPNGWRLRRAMLDGRVIDAIDSPSIANRVKFWIPRQPSTFPNTELSLIFDGPQSIIQHRERIDFPVIKPSCPVLSQRLELWLPRAFSVQMPTSRSQLAFPALELSKLLPSRWYRLLKLTSTSDSTLNLAIEHRMDAAEKTSDSSSLARSWSTEWGDDIQKNPRSLTVLVNESKRAEDWIMVFAGFAISLCLAHLRKSYLIIAGLILAFGILATNGRTLEAIQLTSLGWIVSVVLLVVHACKKPNERAADQSFPHSGEQASRSKTSLRSDSKSERLGVSKTLSRFSSIWIGWVIAIPVGIGPSPYALAQSQPEKIYHIVLPFDSNDEPSKEVAYVSEDLLQELYQHKKAQDHVTQFLSARYELRSVESELRNSSNNALLTLRYEIDVRDLRQPISLPLQAEQANFVALLIDGSEIPLGSRLRWDEHVLQWTPPNRGITQIELTVAATVKLDTDGRSMIEVAVLPLAGAQLDIETTAMIDIQSNAMGQVLNPISGQLQAALGPRNVLKVSWQRAEKELRVATPTAIVANEFALLDDTVLARTNIELNDASLRSDRFDIECDSAWQPLGRRWGAATLIDSQAASSTTRRRYRLRWEETGSERRNSRTVEIYWAVSSSRATLMNLPEIELPGVRIQENLIRFVRRKDSEWTFEGLQSWTKVELSKRFDWLPRAAGEITSYRKPLNAPPAILRRKTTAENRPARLESQLRFLTNEVHCKTTVTLNSEIRRQPDVNLTLPADVEVKTVLANQIEIPFSLLQVDDDHVQLQVFLDPDSDTLNSIIIESTQPYVDLMWKPLPLPDLETYSVSEHLVSATRVVSQLVEWEGLDTPTRPPQSSSATLLPDKRTHNLEVDAWSTRLSVASPANNKDSSAQENSRNASPQRSPRYRILRSREANPGYVISRLTRDEERWNFHVHGLVDAGVAPIDGVLMDMPLSILESLQCNHRMMRFASPEASRQLVYVFSDEPSSNQSFEFEITSSLPPTESNSTTEVPEIRMMGDFEWQQWLIVPRSIANQETRWSLSGARAVDATSVPDFAKSNLPDLTKNFLVVVPTTDRPNVRLSNVAANPLPIALKLVTHEGSMHANQLQNVSSTFFFIPRGQLSIPMRVPAHLRLLAVECNGHRVPMSSINLGTRASSAAEKDESLLSIRLFSSSMPQKITLYTNSYAENNQSGLDIRSFPEIVNATPEKSLIVLDSPDGIVGYGAQTIDSNRSQELLATTVLEIVEQASGFIAEASQKERLQWWQDWEQSTSKIWRDATLLPENDFQKAIGKRRQILFDRLQLPAPTEPPASTLRQTSDYAFEIADTSLSRQASKPMRQHYFIDAEINSTLDLQIRSLVPNLPDWLDSNVWFGWSLWFVSAILSIRFTHQRFDQWIVPLKQFVFNRPWWLFGALGLLSFAIAPSQWYGPGFLVLSLYYAIRTYWHEVRRASTDRMGV